MRYPFRLIPGLPVMPDLNIGIALTPLVPVVKATALAPVLPPTPSGTPQFVSWRDLNTRADSVSLSSGWTYANPLHTFFCGDQFTLITSYSGNRLTCPTCPAFEYAYAPTVQIVLPDSFGNSYAITADSAGMPVAYVASLAFDHYLGLVLVSGFESFDYSVDPPAPMAGTLLLNITKNAVLVKTLKLIMAAI